MQYFSNRQQVLLGISTNHTGDVSILVRKRRSRNWVVKLSPTKAEIVSRTIELEALNYGIELLEGEFAYQSAAGFLEITNTEDCIGIEPHASNSRAITITLTDDLKRAISTVHAVPTIAE